MKTLQLTFFLVLLCSSEILSLRVKPVVVTSKDDSKDGASVAGFKINLSTTGLNYLASVGTPILASSVNNLAIGAMTGVSGSPIGEVEYELWNILIQALGVGATKIKPADGGQVTLELSGVQIEGFFLWHYKKLHGWPHIGDKGTANYYLANTVIDINLRLTESGGRPRVTVSTIAINIGVFDIKVHGGDSWVYNFLIDNMKGKLTAAVEQELQTYLPPVIQDGLNKALDSLPLTQPITSQAEMQFSLVSNPTTTAASVSLPESGEVLGIAHQNVCPASVCPQVPAPDSIHTGKYVELAISEYVANTAAYAYFSEGLLAATITASQVPSYSPIQLNTTSLQYIIPELYASFPNDLVQLAVTCASSPSLSMSPNGIAATVVANVAVQVNDPTKGLVTAFVLTATSSVTGTASLKGTSIVVSLTAISTTLTLQSSNIGPVSVDILNKLVNAAISSGVIPAINNQLAGGFPLPNIPGLQFVNPTLQWASQSIIVASDFTYHA